MPRMVAYNLVILAVLAVGFVVAPSLYANQDVLFQTMMYLVLAQGVNLLYGFTGYLPFGYVGFFGTGAYGAAMSVTLWHFSAFPALLVGGLSALLLGLILSPLLRLSGAYFAIGSLAASEIVYNVVGNPALGNVTGGPYGVSLSAIFNANLSYYVMLGVMLVGTAVVMAVRNSRWGREFLAIREDAVSAAMAGVNVVRDRVWVWLVSAFLAGITGALFAWHTSVFYPDAVFTLSISIFAIVFTLFGGGGTVLGPIVGVIILFGLYNAIGISDPQYFQLIYGVLVMAFVLFLPKGLLSMLQRRGVHVP